MLPGCADEAGADGDAACFEWSAVEDIGSVYLSNTCEYERPCEHLSLRCPGTSEAVDCDLSDAVIENPEALLCILDALAEEEEGAFSWSATADDDPGWAERTHRLWTRGGRTYHASNHNVDLSTDADGVREVQLRPPSDFAACRDKETDAERIACLMDPWTEVLEVVLPPNGG